MKKITIEFIVRDETRLPLIESLIPHINAVFQTTAIVNTFVPPTVVVNEPEHAYEVDKYVNTEFVRTRLPDKPPEDEIRIIRMASFRCVEKRYRTYCIPGPNNTVINVGRSDYIRWVTRVLDGRRDRSIGSQVALLKKHKTSASMLAKACDLGSSDAALLSAAEEYPYVKQAWQSTFGSSTVVKTVKTDEEWIPIIEAFNKECDDADAFKDRRDEAVANSQLAGGLRRSPEELDRSIRQICEGRVFGSYRELVRFILQELCITQTALAQWAGCNNAIVSSCLSEKFTIRESAPFPTKLRTVATIRSTMEDPLPPPPKATVKKQPEQRVEKKSTPKPITKKIGIRSQTIDSFLEEMERCLTREDVKNTLVAYQRNASVRSDERYREKYLEYLRSRYRISTEKDLIKFLHVLHEEGSMFTCVSDALGVPLSVVHGAIRLSRFSPSYTARITGILTNSTSEDDGLPEVIPPKDGKVVKQSLKPYFMKRPSGEISKIIASEKKRVVTELINGATFLNGHDFISTLAECEVPVVFISDFFEITRARAYKIMHSDSQDFATKRKRELSRQFNISFGKEMSRTTTDVGSVRMQRSAPKQEPEKESVHSEESMLEFHTVKSRLDREGLATVHELINDLVKAGIKLERLSVLWGIGMKQLYRIKINPRESYPSSISDKLSDRYGATVV
jgi:hypothetical protein